MAITNTDIVNTTDKYIVQAKGIGGEEDQIINKIVLGKSFLYVGGLPQMANNIRKMVNQMGGELIHHNGRKGKSSIASLANLVAHADAVFVPMDNVSHNSALEAKKLCKQLKRQFIPIKSSGVASFTNALTMIGDG